MKTEDTDKELLELLKRQDAANTRRANLLRRQSEQYSRWGGWCISAAIGLPILIAMLNSSDTSEAPDSVYLLAGLLFIGFLLPGLILNSMSTKNRLEANALQEEQKSDDDYEQDYL